MDPSISLHVQMFNNKVRAMNQTQNASLTLSAAEARGLHNDIFSLMAQIADLSKLITTQTTVVREPTQLNIDGGKF